MYAVIRTGGKQYKVAKGDSALVERLEIKPDDEVTFDEVIPVNGGKSTKIDTLIVESIKAVAKVKKQGREKGVVTFEHKLKEYSHTKYGHRQPYTEVTIENVET